ncbi:MAG: transposase [Candidatus Tagabacteria bacterium]
MLYYFNNQVSPANIFRDLRDLLKSDFNRNFTWPAVWPARKPIVKILVFSLLKNHFHLLLKEIQEGGVTMFMRKFGTGMTNYFNSKYQEKGRLFQGAYKARLIDSDIYLKYLSVYIQVKNPFELYPGGLGKAVKEFNKAFDFAIDYPYCSLADYAGDRESPIIDKDLLGELFPNPKDYKNFARECILGMNLEEKLGDVIKDIA